MSLYKRPKSPFWWYKFKINKRTYTGSCETENKREAGRVEDQRRAEKVIELSLAPVVIEEKQAVTLGPAIKRYVDEVVLEDIASVGVYLDKIVGHMGHDKLLIDINDDDIAELVKWRSAQHAYDDPKRGLLTAASVNRSTVQALQPVFTHAHDEWKVNFTNQPNWKKHKLEEKKRRPHILKASEADAFEGVMSVEYDKMFQFHLKSGLRKRECLIRWSEVDFEDQEIRVIGKRRKELVRPITPEIKELLVSCKDDHPEFVFTFVARRTQNGKVEGKRYPITYWGWSTEYKRRRKDAGVKGLRIHDLRHTFATKLYERTGDLKLVKDMLGHAHISTTELYAHNSTKRLREILATTQAAETEEQKTRKIAE